MFRVLRKFRVPALFDRGVAMRAQHPFSRRAFSSHRAASSLRAFFWRVAVWDWSAPSPRARTGRARLRREDRTVNASNGSFHGAPHESQTKKSHVACGPSRPRGSMRSINQLSHRCNSARETARQMEPEGRWNPAGRLTYLGVCSSCEEAHSSAWDGAFRSSGRFKAASRNRPTTTIAARTMAAAQSASNEVHMAVHNLAAPRIKPDAGRVVFLEPEQAAVMCGTNISVGTWFSPSGITADLRPMRNGGPSH